jgi:hypothetical protein
MVQYQSSLLCQILMVRGQLLWLPDHQYLAQQRRLVLDLQWL